MRPSQTTLVSAATVLVSLSSIAWAQTALPDPVIAEVQFTGTKGSKSHRFAGRQIAVLTLPPTEIMKNNYGTFCWYDMTVTSINAGPGDLQVKKGTNVFVKFTMQFEHGGEHSDTFVSCFDDVVVKTIDDYLNKQGTVFPPGAGCAERLKLVPMLPGSTVTYRWEIDPWKTLKEHNESNNVYQLEVRAPKPCEGTPTIAGALKPKVPAITGGGKSTPQAADSVIDPNTQAAEKEMFERFSSALRERSVAPTRQPVAAAPRRPPPAPSR